MTPAQHAATCTRIIAECPTCAWHFGLIRGGGLR